MRNGGIQIRISDMLFILKKRWKTIAGLTLLGLMFGFLLSGMTYVQTTFQTFEIKGSFAIATTNDEGRYINGTMTATNNDYHLAEDMVDAVRYVILSDKVIDAAVESTRDLVNVTASQIRSNLTVEQYKDTQILEMTLNWGTVMEGQMVWEAVFSAANTAIPEVLMLGQLTRFTPEPAATMVGVGGPGSLKLWVVLALLGFVAGVGVALMELLIHPTINNVRDVETMLGLETIGVIPQNNRFFRSETSLLSAENASSDVVQSYSAAAYILRNRMGTREKHHCFYVTSAGTREGKTTAAANLAVQLSDMEHKTLLIDFNTRNPGLGALFLPEVDYAHSLNALYRGEATVSEAITTLTGNLDLLPTVLEHTPIPMDSTVEELFRQLTEQYEYVIIDAGPVGQLSDTLSLNRVASAVLFVIGYDSATIPDIQASLEKLDKSGTRVVGCIVNGVTRGKNTREDLPRARRRKPAPAVEPFAPPAERELIDELGAAPVPAKPAPAPLARPRNVMDELLATTETSATPSDEDLLSSLLKMGSEAAAPDQAAEAPAQAEPQPEKAPEANA